MDPKCLSHRTLLGGIPFLKQKKKSMKLPALASEKWRKSGIHGSLFFSSTQRATDCHLEQFQCRGQMPLFMEQPCVQGFHVQGSAWSIKDKAEKDAGEVPALRSWRRGGGGLGGGLCCPIQEGESRKGKAVTERGSLDGESSCLS